MWLFEIGKPVQRSRLARRMALLLPVVLMSLGVPALRAQQGDNPSQYPYQSVGLGLPGDKQGELQIGRYSWQQGSARTSHSIAFAPQADIWRFAVRRGENEVPANAQSDETVVKDRAELWMLGNTPNSFRQGACVSFDLYLDKVPVKAGGWTVLGQWHAVEDPGDVHLSPVLAAEYDPEGFRIVTRSDFAARQSLPNKPARVAYEDAQYPFHQWVHWKYDVVFSTDQPTGSLLVWRDGNKVIDQRNVAIGYNDQILPRFQFGVYRGGSVDGDAVVYYKNLHIKDGRCGYGGM